MSGDIDGIGDLVTGALLGSVVSKTDHAHPGDGSGRCLNCGTDLIGSHCHQCGQSAYIHRSLGAFFHDLLHGVLHFDGKIWRTLPMLAIRPGELTRRYIFGERARFVSPLALFLFAVFILFAVASFTLPDSDSLQTNPGVAVSLEDGGHQISERLKANEAALKADNLEPDKRARLESAVENDRTALKVLATAQQTLIDKPMAKTDNQENRDRARSSLENYLEDKLQKARANPALLTYKIKTNAYKFGWALIPLSVPFVWLVTIGRGMRQRAIYDHVIFTTYSIAFMMLLLITLVLAGTIGVPTPILVGIGMLYPPFHMYRQLKGAYRLSRPSALVRTMLLVTFAIISFSVFSLGLIAAGMV